MLAALLAVSGCQVIGRMGEGLQALGGAVADAAAGRQASDTAGAETTRRPDSQGLPESPVRHPPLTDVPPPLRTQPPP